jgi:hypothetical protein
LVELFNGFYDVRTKWIQMYVAEQLEKVIVFMAEYGFAAVLKQMSAALLEAVVVPGLLGELFK